MFSLKLLYVEDDEETREDIIFLLKRNFSEIITAEDGNQALNFFKENNPDIVILDINIPFMDGLKVAKKIKEIKNDIPIIFLTAYSESEKILTAINQISAISYLVKPFNFIDLDKSIKKAINLINVDNNERINLENDFIWNKNIKELYYKNKIIKLTKNESIVVDFLVMNRNKYFSPTDLSHQLFSEQNRLIEANNIIQLFSRLKRSILNQTCEGIILVDTLYGTGYRIR